MKRKYQDYLYFDPNAGSFIDDQLQKYQNQLAKATSEAQKSTINQMINTFTLEKDVRTKYNDLFMHDESGKIELPDYNWVMSHVGNLLTKSSSENFKNLSALINSYTSYINELVTLGADTNTITEMTKWTEGYTRIAYRILYGTKNITKDEDNWKIMSENFNTRLENSVKMGESEDLNIDIHDINHFDETLRKYFPIVMNKVTGKMESSLYDNTDPTNANTTLDDFTPDQKKNFPNSNNTQPPGDMLNDFWNGFWNGFTHAPGMLGELIKGGDINEYIKHINDPNSDDAKDPFGLGKFFGSIFDSLSKIFGGALGIDTTMVKWVFIGVVSYIIYREIKPWLKSSE